jgi:hypothetical protein
MKKTLSVVIVLIVLQIGQALAQKDSVSYFASWLYHVEFSGVTLTSADNGIFRVPKGLIGNEKMKFIQEQTNAIYVIDYFEVTCPCDTASSLEILEKNPPVKSNKPITASEKKKDEVNNLCFIKCKFVVLETFEGPETFPKSNRNVTYMIMQGETYVLLDCGTRNLGIIQKELNKDLKNGNPQYREKDYKILLTGL